MGFLDEIYPLTIVSDRYTGTYSHGLYTAWNEDAWLLPKEIADDDVICSDFWAEFEQGKKLNSFGDKLYCGMGNTPSEALNALESLIKQT